MEKMREIESVRSRERERTCEEKKLRRDKLGTSREIRELNWSLSSSYCSSISSAVGERWDCLVKGRGRGLMSDKLLLLKENILLEIYCDIFKNDEQPLIDRVICYFC